MITFPPPSGQRSRSVARTLVAVATAAVLGAACATRPEPSATAPRGFAPADWTLVSSVRSVETRSAMVVSVHPIASEVGTVILRQGGNAVDAAVAVGFALAVVHPAAGNIGGGGFMIVRLADGSLHALDFRETAPGRATVNMFLDSQGELADASLIGHLASGVPGSVAGLVAGQARLGRLPLRDVMAPAIRLARDGFVLDASRARSLHSAARRLARFDGSRRTFFPDGATPAEGTLFVQADLSRTLEAIAEHGADGFYRGWVADSIVAEMERGGGLITHADLEEYTATWRQPLEFSYRGYRVVSMPAPSSGVTLAQILNMLELSDPLPPFGSAERAHLWTEVMRRAFTDRNQFLGDPGFVDVPAGQLVSKEYAARRFAEIATDRATPSGAIDPGVEESEETTHYSVVDADGNAVSVTTTINGGYGSGVTVSGAGFLLNNEMDDFAAAPGRPNVYGLIQGDANAIAPGKRMLSSMIPTILVDPAGELFMVLGSPGGPTIITTVAQVITNVIDHGMSLPVAIAVPRLHHQALPDSLRFEAGGLFPDVVRALQALGHVPWERSGYSGEVAAILRTPGGLVGVADPRSSGGAAGY